MQKYAIGIDIGGTRTKVGMVDLEKGRVLDMILTPTEKNDPDLFIANLYRQYSILKTRNNIEHLSIAGVGIGAPGFVYDDGSVDSTFGFIPFMDAHYPLKARLEQEFILPCRVDNDARIVALGEALYGRGSGFGRVLVLTLGTGLGVGLVVNGRFDTQLPYAHLGGHITIATSDIRCYCGRIGCMEALVSASGIIEAASRRGMSRINQNSPLQVEEVFEAAQYGNEIAINIISDFLEYLKTGISNFITLFAPDIIIIGGGVSKAMNPYLGQLLQLSYLNPFTQYKFEIALSELDERSGILGSAALFLQ